jgi:hypothetical protein
VATPAQTVGSRPPFTEPTLANGAAYVPSVCVGKGTSASYQNCGQVPAADIASGILVFSACQ